MRTPTEHIKTIQRRIDFLKSRPHQNSFDLAELGSLEWAIKLLYKQEQGEPLFWYRPVGEDGLYEGPIHNASIEKVRKECGAWKPLYTTPQPKQEQNEPVAWMDKNKFEHLKKNNAVLTTVTSWGAFDDDVPLYTTPPTQEFVCSTGLCHYKPAIVQRAEEAFESAKQREWVGLTDEEYAQFSQWAHIEIIERLEAKLKEKNT